jgi:hypothetical protein
MTAAVAAFVALQMLFVAPSYGAEPSRPQFTDEFSKQEKIFQSKDQTSLQSYVVDRSLLSYLVLFPPEFTRSLASLKQDDRWLDVGAGEGRAVLDYETSKYDVVLMQGVDRPGNKAKAVAMSIEDRRSDQWNQTAASVGSPTQMQYLYGKRLREYSLQELGQFQLISDLLGGFSYTQDITLFMQKALSFLTVNGSLYSVLQDVHFEKGDNKPFYEGSPFLTEIEKSDGSELRMCSWLKTITCVEVTCTPNVNTEPPLERYHVRKLCNDVSVPVLEPVRFSAGTPPERRFRLKN